MPRGIKRGSKCREGCSTRDHVSYSDCLRNAGIRVAYTNSVNGWDATKEKKWTAENDRYSDMQRAGIDPSGVTHAQMDETMRKHEKAQALGNAVSAGDFDIN